MIFKTDIFTDVLDCLNFESSRYFKEVHMQLNSINKRNKNLQKLLLLLISHKVYKRIQ